MPERTDEAPLDPALREALEWVARGEWGPPVPLELGPYRRGRMIGRGGMGAVYEATDTRLLRSVALKVARRGDEAALAEARHAAAVEHPNVARIYDVGEAHGFTYVAMERITGAQLSELTFSRAHARHVARQLLAAVAAAHQRGVVHRDLKPANVMVTGELVVKVLDFGLAQLDGAPGQRAGTEGFSAPEQTRGDAIDARADVYSLGRIFETLGLGVDPLFSGIVAQCTASEPGARPADAGRVLAELDRVRDRRTRRLSVAAGLALAAVAALALFVPRLPSATVRAKERVFATTGSPLRAVALGPEAGAFVAATAEQLEWATPGGGRIAEPWPHGQVLDVAWGSTTDAWVLATTGIWRAAPGKAPTQVSAGHYLHLKPSHDGAFAVTATARALFKLSAAGELEPLLEAEHLGDFDVSPDGTQVAFITVVADKLPLAELWLLDLSTRERRRIGEAELGLEGGRTGFAWPREGVWLTARAGKAATLKLSRAGSLEPSRALGELPLSAVSSLDARKGRVFFLQSVLQSDVYAGSLDGGALDDLQRLTDTPANERLSAFRNGELLGISDAFGGWSIVRFDTGGGAPLRLSPTPGLVWPARAADGGLWAFALEPAARGVKPVLLELPGRRVRELREAAGTYVPPPPLDARVSCHARGCALLTTEGGRLRVEGLDYALELETDASGEGIMGASLSASGRWLGLPDREAGARVLDLDGDGGARYEAKGCIVHAVSVDDTGTVVTAEECDGAGRLVLRGAGDAHVLMQSPFIVTSPQRDGDRLAFIVKHERCEAWSWEIDW